MTGAYFRVQREGKWENIEVEHLTDEERAELFMGKDEAFIMGTLHLMSHRLVETENLLNDLAEEGILEKQ